MISKNKYNIIERVKTISIIVLCEENLKILHYSGNYKSIKKSVIIMPKNNDDAEYASNLG